MDVLKNSPQIAELLEILDRNGLTKEKDEVTSLVDYIGSMENTLSSMMNELSEMRNEVRQIHDNTLRAKCSQLLQNTGDKVKQAAKMVGTAKDNLIRGAERAIQEFKLRGKDALIKAVEAMKIPKTIQALQKCFGNLSKHMEHSASRMDVFRSEMQDVGAHLKKAGRTLFGMSAKETKKHDADKGILAKLGKAFSGLAEKFSGMEKALKRWLKSFRARKNP